MSHGPDWTGAIFFGLCGLFCLCLTRWPQLWIAISINRRRTAEELPHRLRALRILTGVAAMGAFLTALLALSAV
jgi:hypothetical protein